MAEKGTEKALERKQNERYVRVLTITKQASAGTFVQAHQTQVLHDPESRTTRSALHVLCNLTLDLQTDLDNLQWVREDLEEKD